MNEKNFLELVLKSDTLTPAEISHALEMDYDRGQSKVTPEDAVRGIPKHVWVLHSGLSASASFDEHFEALMERVAPLRQKLRELGSAIEIRILFASYTDRTNVGVHLGRRHLEWLVGLGADFFEDCYVGWIPADQ